MLPIGKGKVKHLLIHDKTITTLIWSCLKNIKIKQK